VSHGSDQPQIEWPEIEVLVRARKHAELVTALKGLNDGQRKGFVSPLKALTKPDADGKGPWFLSGSLALVGAAVLPDARTTASWFRRYRPQDLLMQTHQQVDLYDEVVSVLVARNPPWLAALLGLLVEKLRFDNYSPGSYRVVEGLRRQLDLAPPASPAYAGMWAWHDWDRDGQVGVLAQVAADPRFAAIVPTLFEVDELAIKLRNFGETFHALVDSGLVDRAAVLDACLARLDRGGRPQSTNDFVAVHDALAPSASEVNVRVRGYMALLSPPSASTVAGMAQRELFRLHDLDQLSIESLTECSAAVFSRTEKKLLRAQLTRLRDHGAKHPNDVPALARAAASALGNTAPDIQRDAISLIRGWATVLDQEALAAVIAARESLPPDLFAELAAVFGSVDPPARPTPVTSTLPAPPARHRVFAIESPEELVEELLVLLRGEGNLMGGLAVERVIEAIPRLAGEDRAKLRHIAGPLLTDPGYAWARDWHEYMSNTTLRRGLVALLAAAVSDPMVPVVDDRRSRDAAPQRAITTRVYDTAAALRRRPQVRVVSLPSWSTGVIEGDDLAARLASAAHDGWEPDDTDLEQALLRLDPANSDPTTFAALGSHAGERAANWIRNGLPLGPRVSLVAVAEYADFANMDYRDRLNHKPRYVSMAKLSPNELDSAGPIWTLMQAWEAPSGGLFAGWDPEAAFDCWPLILPRHRDLVAAHLLPELSRARSARSPASALLVTLAEADGPVGDALLAAVTYGLGAKRPDAQAAAADALLVLASRDQIDGVAMGAILSMMIQLKAVVPKRVVGPLVDAAGAGAAVQVWATIKQLLELVLPLSPTLPGLVDIISAAAQVAEIAGAHDNVSGLVDLAGRHGNSRQIVEGRRLLSILAAK